MIEGSKELSIVMIRSVKTMLSKLNNTVDCSKGRNTALIDREKKWGQESTLSI